MARQPHPQIVFATLPCCGASRAFRASDRVQNVKTGNTTMLVPTGGEDRSSFHGCGETNDVGALLVATLDVTITVIVPELQRRAALRPPGSRRCDNLGAPHAGRGRGAGRPEV